MSRASVQLGTSAVPWTPGTLYPVNRYWRKIETPNATNATINTADATCKRRSNCGERVSARHSLADKTADTARNGMTIEKYCIDAGVGSMQTMPSTTPTTSASSAELLRALRNTISPTATSDVNVSWKPV